MPQAPYISVVVPVYNVERYVKVCIDSILAQTFQDFEVIIVDDCSTDNSYQICTELYGNNEKIRIIRHEKNSGQGIARNTGMSVARGKYICFVDSDDVISKISFEKFHYIAEKIDAEVIRFTGYMVTHQETSEFVNIDKEFKIQWLNSELDGFLDENIPERLQIYWSKLKEGTAVWSCFYEREFLEKYNIKFEPIMVAEDGLFIFECLCFAKKYYLVHDVFYAYRKHKGSTMTFCSLPRLESTIKAFFIVADKMNVILSNIPEFANDRLTREQHIQRLLGDIFKFHIAKFCADPEWREELDRIIYERFLPIFTENTTLVKFFFNELIELQIAKTPAISVIVPVYNVERYVALCINSILQQTFQDFEIIIVDDFSTDTSYKICKSVYGDHKKIRILRHEKNQGLGSARNTGITNSRGKYICFVDSDDALLPNALEVLYNVAEETGADVVHTSGYYETYQDDDQSIKLYNSPIAKEPYNKVGFLDKNIRYRLEKCWRCWDVWDSEDGIRPMAWLHFCRRDIFAKFPLRFESIISEDELFSFELFCYIEKFFVIDEALYVYRRCKGSIMKSYTPKRLIDGIAGMRRCVEKMKFVMNDFPEFSGNTLIQEYLIYKIFENFLGNHITPFYRNGLNKELNDSITTVLEPLFKENTTFVKYFFNASNYFKIQLENSNRNVQQLYKGYQDLSQKNQSLSQNHQRMSLFLQEQAAILKLFDEMKSDDKKIFLVGTPRHGNIGDQAIVFAEYFVLKKCFPDYQIVDVPYPYLTGELSEIFYGLGFQKYVQPDDLIVMHGGGNLGNLWVNEEIFRRNVIEKFHENKIIIFPQSIYFTYDAEGQSQIIISKQVYNAHPDLHLMLRDENSFNFANEVFTEINTYLLPDVVTALYGITDNVKVEREGVLFVLRHDKEKVRDDSTVQRLQEFLTRLNIPFSVIDTVVNEIIYKENREKKVLDVLMKIRQSRLVITDRFHGVVFSYVTRTPVMAFKSFDTKISSGIKWFKDIPSIFYGEGKTFSDMTNFIAQFYNQTLPAQVNTNFVANFTETLQTIVPKQEYEINNPVSRLKFVECLVPISHCNLHCDYCYVLQGNYRDIPMPAFRCTPEEIGIAFKPERWNAQRLFVSFCGAGETFLCKELSDIVRYVLEQGNFVNITTNGTIEKEIEKLISLPTELTSRLVFAFSLHYNELKRKNLLETFAKNVKKVADSDASFLVQLNLYDGYIDYLDEIKEYCIKNFGAPPQLVLTRDQTNGMKIHSSHSMEVYRKYGEDFKSQLFEFTCDNFLKKRENFCFAGEKSYTLQLATGDLRRCYFDSPLFNIYDDLESRVPESPVGYNCKSSYCVNASHFLSLGVMPEFKCPSYAQLRNRKEGSWYKETILNALNEKFDCRISDKNLKRGEYVQDNPLIAFYRVVLKQIEQIMLKS